MSEKRYKNRLEFQNKIILKQSEQIEELKNQIENLKLEIKEKDKLINSIDFLRSEFNGDVSQIRKYKKEYQKLIQELKDMKKIVNQEVYRGRWKIVRWIINL